MRKKKYEGNVRVDFPIGSLVRGKTLTGEDASGTIVLYEGDMLIVKTDSHFVACNPIDVTELILPRKET